MPPDLPPVPFEGEVLAVWGRTGARPVVLAAVHRVAARGPVIELVLAGVAPGRRPGMVRRVLAASGPGVDLPASVNWLAQDRLREVHWDEGGLKMWAGTGRRSIPARVPAWLLGEGRKGRPSLPTRVFLAQVEVVVPKDGQLAPFAGRRHGMLFSTACLVTDPPRLRLPLPNRVEATPELS
jgi:hypothetical protein